ncbi:hypothetical protein GCM10022206_59330 [Streptomyces chiangmaiensis]
MAPFGRVVLALLVLEVPKLSVPSVVAVADRYVLPYSVTGNGNENVAEPVVVLDRAVAAAIAAPRTDRRCPGRLPMGPTA